MVNVSAAVSIEEIESLLNLLSLLFSELSRFLRTLDGGLLVGLLVVGSLPRELKSAVLSHLPLCLNLNLIKSPCFL